tara:strand:- start:14024 stop:15046 length:1023 start_codon:yes stop_codon:yes gene_type:complete
MSITQSPKTEQSEPWQQALKNLIRCPKQLLQHLDLSLKDIPWQIDPQFPLRVSLSFANKIQKSAPYDPLLRQVLSTKSESLFSDKFVTDPLQEATKNPIPGLLHKFSNRVLLTVTQACPVHCRYCFRRHFPYSENKLNKAHWPQIKRYLQEHKNIHEVVLSGGDPLMLTDAHLANLMGLLEEIPHIQIIRFHTRMPVMIPERISPNLIKILQQSTKKIVLVYHINHANELCEDIKAGVAKLKNIGCTVLNQNVLLKGVNDNITDLTKLCWSLFQADILPYYIHLLDSVAGAQHFDVPLEQALKLEQALMAELPGYCVPKFVKEIPGKPSKILIKQLARKN